MDLIKAKELMEACFPLYPDGAKWETTIAYILQNDSENMSELRKDFLKHRTFREPITIEFDDTEENLIVTNGTHRLITAYLVNPESKIPVFFNDSGSYDENSGESSEFDNDEEIICLATIIIPGESIPEEVDIYSTVRSFKLTPDIWMESDFAFENKNKITIYWDSLNVEDSEIITKKVIERLKPYKVEVKTMLIID